MLNFGNKEFRNLQEQVLKNAQDIETLKGREDLQIVIVNELPEVGNPNYIYLVAKDDGEQPDIYDEYIWLEDEERYEKIGGVTIDLSNYVTLDSEQTITGAKSFSTAPLPSSDSSIDLGSASYQWKDLYLSGSIVPNGNLTIGKAYNQVVVKSWLIPQPNNTYDLGTSSLRWKDLYLSGIINQTNYNISWDNGIIFKGSSNSTIFYIGNNGQPWVYGDIIPAAGGSKSLGNTTHFFTNLYLTGNITDGANTVSVTNIASKATSTFISGTFDANGETTIDTEQEGTPEGLFIFTYGNCQCFLRLTATMVQNADTAPIRIACPMIYNSDTVNGWLNITRAGYILIVTITDGTNHVDSGYSWTLTKTNLI